jgi:hypothetical protein
MWGCRLDESLACTSGEEFLDIVSGYQRLKDPAPWSQYEFYCMRTHKTNNFAWARRVCPVEAPSEHAGSFVPDSVL